MTDWEPIRDQPKRCQLVYRPRTLSGTAELLAQVMEAERITAADLAMRAGYSRQSVYAAFSDDRRGVREFSHRLAVILLEAMGYRMEIRAVKAERKGDDDHDRSADHHV